MKFKTFVNLQENDIIIHESVEALTQLKKIKELQTALDYDTFQDTLKRVGDYLKSSIKDQKIEILKNTRNSLIHDVEVITKALLMIKSTIKTKYFDKLVIYCGKLLNSIKEHFINQEKIYAKSNR